MKIGLREYASKCDFVILQDIESLFDKRQKGNEKYWSDYVHFSELGYKELGRMLFITLIEFSNERMAYILNNSNNNASDINYNIC